MNKLIFTPSEDGTDTQITFTNQFGTFSWSPKELQEDLELAKFRKLIDKPNGRIEVIGVSKTQLIWDSYQKTLYLFNEKNEDDCLKSINVSIYAGNPYLTSNLVSIFRYLLPYQQGGMIDKRGDKPLFVYTKAIHENIKLKGSNFCF